jgi:mRNA-degrading endonuclease toxin of MazEF toxin-antitoxin module
MVSDTLYGKGFFRSPAAESHCHPRSRTACRPKSARVGRHSVATRSFMLPLPNAEVVSAIAPRRGEVWLANTPGYASDQATRHPRFVLVVSADALNRNRDHVMVVPIVSTGNLSPTRLVIPAQRTGLHHDGVLSCEELTTIDKPFFEPEVGPRGHVDRALLDAVIVAVRRALGDMSG